jgi:hypothetical protein
MHQYKYKLIKLDTSNRHFDDIEQLLNQYGDEGYEFVDIKEMWSLTDSGYEVKQDVLILRMRK